MMLRSFIAVKIPADIQKLLESSLAPLQRTLPKPLVRWVASQNVHLTLKFLGDIPPEGIDRLAEALKTGVQTLEKFNLSIDRLGIFPVHGRPRIIWIGVDAPAALLELVRCVEELTVKMGFTPEDRSFSPHLTIGRVKQAVSGIDSQHIRAALEGTVIDSLGIVHVDSIHIFKSDLQPGGPVYTALYDLPLNEY